MEPITDLNDRTAGLFLPINTIMAESKSGLGGVPAFIGAFRKTAVNADIKPS
jgi:hypothetical protein